MFRVETSLAAIVAALSFAGCHRRAEGEQRATGPSHSDAGVSSMRTGNLIAADDLALELPPGWVERPNPRGPWEFWAKSDGTTGLLQVSKFSRAAFELIARQPDLAAFTAELGEGLGAGGRSWGEHVGAKEGLCALGRYGFSTFKNDEYPAMLLWVTVSDDAAWMWTWLGPALPSDAVDQAARVVLGARKRQ
jgi:hypothetical protein